MSTNQDIKPYSVAIYRSAEGETTIHDNVGPYRYDYFADEIALAIAQYEYENTFSFVVDQDGNRVGELHKGGRQIF